MSKLECHALIMFAAGAVLPACQLDHEPEPAPALGSQTAALCDYLDDDCDPPDLDDDYPHAGPIAPAPSGLTSFSLSEAMVRLRFTCGGNADYHEWYRRPAGSTTYTKLSNITCSAGLQPIVSDSTVQPETGYCYRVKAVNTTHFAYSSTLCVTTPAPMTAPVAPSVFVQTSWSNRNRVIYRDNATNENTFRVYRRTAGTSAWMVLDTVSRGMADRDVGGELIYDDLGLSANTTYEYLVQASYVPTTPGGTTRTSSSGVATGWTRPAAPASTAGSCTASGSCDDTVTLSNGQSLTIYRNFDLAALRSSIRRLVVVVHGSSRNAADYFDTVVGSATSNDVLGETLVVAPYFAQWGEDWREGGNSITLPWLALPITSFTAMDQLIIKATDPARFPGLREVVVTGHSAGGQFTQRYAATTTVLSSRPALRFRFVPANSSSYMYLNHLRPSTSGTFVVPAGCSDYDDYKYGLKDRYGHAATRTDAQIRVGYSTRDVYYLLGQDDTFDEGSMDTGCEANAQGPHRLLRGIYYYRHMLKYFVDNQHRKMEVPDVGHSRSIWARPVGASAIFF